MSGVTIRDATVADAGLLSAAGRRLFVQTYGEGPNASDMAAHVDAFFGEPAIADELQKPDVCYLVAFDSDAVAGFAKYRRGPVPDAVPAAAATEVQHLYVDAAMQRQGIGRRLMDRVVANVAMSADEGIWLSVWQEADWAIAFYESCGFRNVGTADFWLGRTHYLDFLMWLPLARPS